MKDRQGAEGGYSSGGQTGGSSLSLSGLLLALGLWAGIGWLLGGRAGAALAGCAALLGYALAAWRAAAGGASGRPPPEERLDLFIGLDPVGHFPGEDFPAVPGLCRYEPYRGQGHFRLTEALRRGPVRCHFTRRGQPFLVLITAEVFVQGGPDCWWAVRVCEVHARGRLRHALAVLWQEASWRLRGRG